ncbi:response regulator [Streptomyces sp. NPDC002446]
MTTPDTAPGILIVDDMEENLVALEAVLGSLTQKVVRARSGEEALKAMLREEFAVVLIDVLMPGMNGFETAANIKGLDQTKDVPIILLTGAAVDPNYAYRGYTVGAADFLIKPFDPWLLRTKVNVFLELHRKNRQLAAQAEQLRRLLTADGGRPSGAAGEAQATPEEETPQSGGPQTPTGEPAVAAQHPAGSAARSPAPPGAARSATARSAEAARLAEVAAQLAQLELHLRQQTGGAEQSDLADRIAELEQAVGRMLADRST